MIARWFWREWRSPSLLIVWLALSLAVACVLALGSIGDRMEKGLSQQSREFMAGDRTLRSSREVPAEWIDEARRLGLTVGEQLSFATMTFAGDTPQLADVKAVDDTYPLYGKLETQPPGLKPQAGSVLLAPRLMALLNLKIGDTLDVGDATLRIAGEVLQEPDAGFNPFQMAPRLMMNTADVAKTGAVQPGSRVSWRYKYAGTPQQLADALQPDTCLVSIMFANNEIGTVQPIAELGALCRERGALFHTDAVQAAGHLAIDVQTTNIDLLSLSGHKFHGPKGAGALYTRRGIALQNVLYGGGQERGHRAGTENVPAIAGLAAALAQADANLPANTARCLDLRQRLTERLLAIPGTHLNGDAAQRLPGNVNITFDGVEAETLLLLLDEAKICASAGSACSAGAVEPSHVLLALGLTPAQAKSTLRLDAANTAEEIDTAAAVITACVQRLRDGVR